MPSLSFLRRHAVAVAVAALAAGAAHAVPIIGLTSTNAFTVFDSATPINASVPVQVTGLQGANERLLAIDLRPTTGTVYAVSDASKVYSVTTAGVATFVGTLSTPLAGSVVGFDFNPVADLAGMASLRIVSSTGQNLAFHVGTGATTVATSVETGFSGVAYSSNDVDPATGTFLYYVDLETDQLKVATANFNNPTIATVGSLGLDVTGMAGFDIYSSATAFAAFTFEDTSKSGLYSIDLASGAASLLGSFGILGFTNVAPPLLGLTAAMISPVPEPETWALMLAGLATLGTMAKRRRQR